MASYEPEEMLLPTGLDTIGAKLSMPRHRGEAMNDYRNRILLERADPSNATNKSFYKNISRNIGTLGTEVFRIDVIRDSQGILLAEDPVVKVSSTKLYLYRDYANGLIDLEIDLRENGENPFLRDIKAIIDTSSYFDLTIVDPDFEFKLSQMLRFGDNIRYEYGQPLTHSMVNSLPHKMIRELSPNGIGVLISEKTSKSDLSSEGDFYLDKDNGVLFTKDFASGFVNYSYLEFPFSLFYEPIRAWPFADPDRRSLTHNQILVEEGQLEYRELNQIGSDLVNTILAVNPTTWSK